MSDDFELILCVMKDGKLHQALLTDDQRSLLRSILPAVIGDNPLKVMEKPICNVEIMSRAK